VLQSTWDGFVALAGLGLFKRGFPVMGTCVEIGLPMLVLFVALSQYLKHVQICHFPILERFSVLISIALVWAYAHILTVSGVYKHASLLTQLNRRTDIANLITATPWIGGIPYPLQWGAPTFSAGHSFSMMAAVVVSLIESTGAFKAAARENVGLLGSTRIGSRRVILISAGFMIFFSILGPFGALFASIPFTLFAAIYCVLFGNVEVLEFSVHSLLRVMFAISPDFGSLTPFSYLVFSGAVGLSFMQFTNMNSTRNLFIIGTSLFPGISIPEYFFQFMTSDQHGPAHTRVGWLNDHINTIFSSPPTVGFIISVVLDNTLEVRTRAKDGGMFWWARFRTLDGDSRTKEFYNLPFNLSRFFLPS
ncbi:Nucleobase-ascorbate transporter 2, partial [Dichanthelium oligosanthes]